ncbi:MAG: RNA polymerase factor sigma-54 [Myxococcota bacterium]
MAIELKQQLKLSQQLVMTPQLQQAIKLLQLNQLELVNLVQQELQENPVLEETEVEEETPAEREDATFESLTGEGDEAGDEGREERGETEVPESGTTGQLDAEDAGERSDIADAGDAPELSFDDLGPAAEAPDGGELAGSDPDDAAPSDADKIADVEWESYLESHPMTGLETRNAGEDDRPSLEATYTRRPSLAEHLEWQLQVSDLDPAELEVAQWIVGNIDEQGYLRATIEEIACEAEAEAETVEKVLKVVQGLDPAGVAARDLRECLLLQLDRVGGGDSLARRVVDLHLDQLQKRDFRGLTKVLGVTIQEIAEATRVIGALEPRPGRGFGGEDPVYITPDIFVYKIGDEFHVLLNEDGLPKLRISSVYRDMLNSGSRGDGQKDTRAYVHDKVRSAMWLIKSIHQRQRTIYKVMQSIIQHQRDFFEHGVAHLKPLNLRDVADDIEMHESTVSRVTTNKYVHTPQGIFELKYFFNSSINRFDGEALASESVKEKIRKIIESEDPARPMSDQRIAEMLKAANIDIARRTVTKYREAMNILSSTQRREVC